MGETLQKNTNFEWHVNITLNFVGRQKKYGFPKELLFINFFKRYF